MAQTDPPEGDPLITAVGELLAANLALQQVLQESAGRMERYLELLAGGARAIDMTRRTPPTAARSEDNQAIDRLTLARRQARAATFHRLIAEGMSRREIAEHWGFSQQVVSRIVNFDGSGP